MRSSLRFVVVIVVLAFGLAACGGPAPPRVGQLEFRIDWRAFGLRDGDTVEIVLTGERRVERLETELRGLTLLFVRDLPEGEWTVQVGFPGHPDKRSYVKNVAIGKDSKTVLWLMANQFRRRGELADRDIRESVDAAMVIPLGRGNVWRYKVVAEQSSDGGLTWERSERVAAIGMEAGRLADGVRTFAQRHLGVETVPLEPIVYYGNGHYLLEDALEVDFVRRLAKWHGTVCTVRAVRDPGGGAPSVEEDTIALVCPGRTDAGPEKDVIYETFEQTFVAGVGRTAFASEWTERGLFVTRSGR